LLDDSDHDHQACRSRAVARAEERCRVEGLRLTAQRRQVLEAMLASHAPVSAYEIMDRIAEGARRPSPISVYRALDFLVANRFAHRIESRNAFLACIEEHGHAAGPEAPLVFLLCERCGSATEAEPAELGALLSGIAAAEGFQPSTSVLEIRGLCAACQTVNAPDGHPHDHPHSHN
jgi:Fur family zinc uptake transcriptional regulator